jgi:ribokinase
MARLVVCGAINWDISCFVERLPVPGEEVIVKNIARVSGGTGGNTAVAAARIFGTKEVALIGALGRDEIARRQIAALEDEGVITDGIDYIEGAESGQAYILIDGTGQNVIASHLGANARLSPEHLNKALVKQQLEECRGIVLTDPALEVAEELIKLAEQRSIPLLWDPGILISPNRDAVQSLAKEVEVLFLNETEANALLGTDGSNTSLQNLRELGFDNHVVLKLGGQGAAMLEPASSMVVEVSALPLKKLGLKVVSTVGCGDVFAGVFAAYYVMGNDPRKSLIMASAAASLNATRPETRGSPERVALEAMAQKFRNLGLKVKKYGSPKTAE